MNNTREVGWGRFLKGFPWYNEEREYPLQAYSEFMPPVRTGDSLRLAHQDRKACQVWNANVPRWNKSPDRKGCKPGERTKPVAVIPPKALHLKVGGEIRTWEDPESSLYNTDGMIFSDTGIPVVLFMENYDIDRTGYHDTHDTMENIDLDYGAAVSAIAIETVARLAAS